MATQLVQELTDQATALIRDELAGVIALFGTGALAVTVAAALALVMPAWAAVLITAVVLFAVAGIAALTGKGQITKPLPEEAMASGRRDVEAVKDAIHRRG
jgi:hypothetical protein